MKETAARVDAEDQRRNARSSLHELGLVYGRVVQAAYRGDARTRRVLLPSALRGLKKLAPAANADVVDACLNQIRGIARDEASASPRRPYAAPTPLWYWLTSRGVRWSWTTTARSWMACSALYCKHVSMEAWTHKRWNAF